MVVLKDIKKTASDISADYYVEDAPPKGFMKIRISDGEIIEHEDGGYGSAHVKRELERLARLDDLPTEKTVFWY